jgi:hypothetical protein
MAKKKKSKGVLEKIGDAVATGTEAVIDAGSKAIHAVGEMMPTGKTPPKRAKASPKAAAKTKAPKAKVKAPKAEAKAKAPKVEAKAKAPAAKVKAKAATPKASKKAATSSKAVKPAAKTTTSPKKKGTATKKG